MGGFSNYLQRTKTYDEDMSRRGTEFSPALKPKEDIESKSSKPISLNIETVINVKNNAGGRSDKVDEYQPYE